MKQLISIKSLLYIALVLAILGLYTSESSPTAHGTGVSPLHTALHADDEQQRQQNAHPGLGRNATNRGTAHDAFPSRPPPSPHPNGWQRSQPNNGVATARAGHKSASA